MHAQGPPTDVDDGSHWYGPKGQFWPHRVIWAIFAAFFHSIWNTIAGIGYCIIHPVKSFQGLAFAIKHPRSTVRGIVQRSHGSMRQKGVVYTATSLICMLVLPGGGLFGQAAEISEHGRKASNMRKQGGLKHA